VTSLTLTPTHPCATVSLLVLDISTVKPQQENGHGTSTASIVAGNNVADASFFGYAHGTSVGIAPHARVAVYNGAGNALVEKALVPIIWGSNVIVVIDAAIADGVNIILVPLGIIGTVPLY